MILFSGTSNKPLAQSIAKQLQVTLGKVEINRFIDNECRVRVYEEVVGKDVFVVQSLSQIADQHLVELCLLGQALKNLKAKKVTAVIPWMGYSKQDKEFRRGEAVSAQLVARFIEVAGFDRVITLELHSENLVPYFKIPITELSTHAILAQKLKKTSQMMVVSPDRGGQSRSSHFAQATHLPIVYLDKQRDLVTGKVKILSTSVAVRGADVVIFDDIINTGATAIKTSEFLKKQGANKIYFLTTHAVLAGRASLELASSPIDQVCVTDTIFIPKEKQFSKLKIVTVAPLLSEEIIRKQS
jgi:ribose-phosphate pyrophosphokinase